MGNSRVKHRFELTLDAKQVVALTVGATVLVSAMFVVGMNFGRRTTAARAAGADGAPALDGAAAPIAPTLAAVKDPLAQLDQPLPAREEPAVELKAHQVLTDARPIDKALPVPPAKVPAAPLVKAAPVQPEKPDVAAATPVPPAATAAAPAKLERAVREGGGRKGAYAIQVASLPKRSDAERVAKQHRTRKTRIVEADVPGKGHYYRVLVGSFETQEAAKRQLASLTRSGVQGIVTAIR